MGRFTLLGIMYAASVWVGASFIHYHHFGQYFHFWPDSPIEAAVRVLMFGALVVAGWYADRFTRLVQARELEKQQIYHEAIHASQHVLNNFLNRSMRMQLEAGKFPEFSQQVLDSFDQSVREAAKQLKGLDQLSPKHNGEIMAYVYPRNDKEADTSDGNIQLTPIGDGA